ncbi:MAG: hypothetical protein ACLP01_32780 [Solirubrobacteraceae bacterium]
MRDVDPELRARQVDRGHTADILIRPDFVDAPIAVGDVCLQIIGEEQAHPLRIDRAECVDQRASDVLRAHRPRHGTKPTCLPATGSLESDRPDCTSSPIPLASLDRADRRSRTTGRDGRNRTTGTFRDV